MQTLVDCAGASMGGAARYLGELENWLARTAPADVVLVGRDHSLSPTWLVRRELGAGRGRRVALNNVSFRTGAERVTLLRNALHFLDDAEYAEHASGLPGTFRAEVRIVRMTARHAHTLVVPCTAMAERVARVEPRLAPRLVVRHHPLTAPTPTPLPQQLAILVPVLFAPYKRMDLHVNALLTALARSGEQVVLRATATRDELPTLADHPRVELLGHLSPAALASEWMRSTAIYYPTELESFGYPLAEGRAVGRAVIALDTEQNREIAGPALRGFVSGDPDSLTDAVADALSSPAPTPDPGEFDADRYFDWLIGTR